MPLQISLASFVKATMSCRALLDNPIFYNIIIIDNNTIIDIINRGKMENYINLVLHPIRMRIIMAAAGRELTAQQLSEALGDVPPATLYRHINRLTKAGVLEVVTERHVRGTLEKVYTLSHQGAFLNVQEFAAISREDHLRYFTAFIATVLDDFSRYVNNAKPFDVIADGVGYQKFPLELSDEEFITVAKGINAAITPYSNNPPAPGRKRHLFTTVVMPDVDSNAAHDTESKPDKELK